MELKLTYESELDAWTLTHKEVRVTSPADVNTWRRLLARQFEKLGGRRSWILIDMADFELAPSVAELYGATAKAPGAEHALGIVRYGRPATVTTTTTVRTQGVMRDYAPNVHPTRLAAIEALHDLRAAAT
jgi:hypothetical protein